MTKREKIIRTLMDYPNLSPWQVSERVGCHVSYVHKVESDWLKDEAKPAATEVMDDRQTEMFEEVEQVSVPASVTPDTIDAVLDERGSRYGKFDAHAEITQTLKRQAAWYLSLRNKKLSFDQQEALDMIFHKIGRIINGDPDYADSWADIAGYAKLVADRLEGKSR
jgi:hypothetical protein